jgi:hypothetical protein
MTQETNTLDGILDIALPLAPVDSGWGPYTGIVVIVLLSGVVIGIGYGWWKNPRRRCQRKLAKLLHRHENGYINAREAIFRLAEILRERIHCHQLSGKIELPMHLQHYQSRWCMFINELDTARYSGAELEDPVLGRLASETRFWLGRW